MFASALGKRVRRHREHALPFVAFVTLAALLGGCGKRESRLFLLVSIDTLRADHLGTYGYPRGTSPAIDRLAEESALFVDCLSVSSWTMPAMGTLGTGLKPGEHGMVYWHLPLAEVPETLSEVLDRSDITTAFIGNPIPLLPGLERGFDLWETFDGDDPAVVARAVQWLEATPDRDRFLWVHLLSPHAPYDPLPETVRSAPELEEPLARYDGEIRTADLYVEDLLSAVGPEAVILLTADHGETLTEREELRYDHGKLLFEELLRIPCLLRVPGTRPGIRSERVALADIPVTICDWFGVDAPQGSRGRSLLPLIENEKPTNVARIYAWVVEDDPPEHKDHRWSVHEGKWKAVFNLDRGTAQLFDLAEDPQERFDIAAERPEEVARLSRVLEARRAETTPPRIPFHERFSPAEIERLQSLGYLGGAAGATGR